MAKQHHQPSMTICSYSKRLATCDRRDRSPTKAPRACSNATPFAREIFLSRPQTRDMTRTSLELDVSCFFFFFLSFVWACFAAAAALAFTFFAMLSCLFLFVLFRTRWRV